MKGGGGLEDEQVNQALEGEGVGSGEREEVGELWNERKKLRERENSFLGLLVLAVSSLREHGADANLVPVCPMHSNHLIRSDADSVANSALR